MGETYHPRGILIDGFKPREHPIYMVWADMKSRCTNTSDKGYENYGGRGITYCEQWKHFANFVEDMGHPPFQGASIDRIDNDEGYSPANCRWADRHQQMRNRRKFKNNQSGETGVVPRKSGFHARYDDHGVRYDLGNFDTVGEASGARQKFIALREASDPTAMDMVSKGNSARRLRRDSSTGVKGVTRHPKGGFLARKTVDGARLYLGFSPTFEGAVALLRART